MEDETIEIGATTCASTRVTVVHIVEPSDVVVRPGESASSFHNLREGALLKLMDLCTCASAERLAEQSCVTLSMDDLVFVDTRIRLGETLEIRSQVNRAWNTSMEVGCTVLADPEEGCGPSRRLCKAFFTFVRLKKKNCNILYTPSLTKPVPVTAENKRRYELAQARRKIRFRRKDIIAQGSERKKKMREMPAALPPSPGLQKTSPQFCKAAPALVVSEIVLPQHANHHGATFGGQIMEWMARSVRIVCSRHINNRDLVCQSIDDILFVAPSEVGDRIRITTTIARTFVRTLEVECEVEAWKVGPDENPRHINSAIWVMETRSNEVALDHNGALLQVDPGYSEEAKLAFRQALGRRALRLERFALGSGHNLDPSWPWPSGEVEGEISWEELAERNMSDMVRLHWQSQSGDGWGFLEAASSDFTKLYMREHEGVIVLKASCRMDFSKLRHESAESEAAPVGSYGSEAAPVGSEDYPSALGESREKKKGFFSRMMFGTGEKFSKGDTVVVIPSDDLAKPPEMARSVVARIASKTWRNKYNVVYENGLKEDKVPTERILRAVEHDMFKEESLDSAPPPVRNSGYLQQGSEFEIGRLYFPQDMVFVKSAKSGEDSLWFVAIKTIEKAETPPSLGVGSWKKVILNDPLKENEQDRESDSRSEEFVIGNAYQPGHFVYAQSSIDSEKDSMFIAENPIAKAEQIPSLDADNWFEIDGGCLAGEYWGCSNDLDTIEQALLFNRSRWDVLAIDSKCIKDLNFLNDEELTMGNDVSQLVIQGEDGSLSDFLLLRSWINSGWDESLSGGPAKFILANHSVRADALFLEAPEEPALKCKRGIASTSGWVAEQEVNREQNYDGYGVLNVSYFVTLAAAGIKALGSTVLDVAAGRSHVICKNMRGLAKEIGAELQPIYTPGVCSPR